MEILAAASEYESIPIRHGEEQVLKKLALHLPLKIEKPNYTNCHTKVNVLLQSHFSRRNLPADLMTDQAFIVENAVRLLQARVDVVSSSSWLSPALAAMELSQMITQAMWDNDSSLKQIPHINDDILKRCAEKKIESVIDLSEVDDKVRNDVLRLSDKELKDVAKACNRYPNIELNFEVQDTEEVTSGSPVNVVVSLEREIDDDEELGPVYAPFFQKSKVEGWWLVVGDPKSNELVSIKRLTLHKNSTVKLTFNAPAAGDYSYTLYFMCDSYSGCDQEYELKLHVKPAEETAEAEAEEEKMATN